MIDYGGTALLFAMLTVGVHVIDGATVLTARDRTTAILAWNVIMLSILAWWWVERRV